MIEFLSACSLIHDSWSEAYPGDDIPPNIQGNSQDDQYKITTEGNFYILQVTFTSLNEIAGQGGAIYVDTATNLLIESSSFIQCHASEDGGAIYFYNKGGKSYLKMVYSTNSYSAKQSNFCYISTKKNDKCTNRLDYSSISNLLSTSNTNIYLRYSDIIILKYDNISKNQCLSKSSIHCSPQKNSDVSYSSFENNTVTSYELMCYGDSKIYYMDTCNVIGNKAKEEIINVVGSLVLSNSCLIENNVAMFRFSSSDNKCTIINCTIDNTEKIGEGNVKIESDKTPSKSFINSLPSFLMKESNSKCICRTLNMIENRCHMLRRNEDFILFMS